MHTRMQAQKQKQEAAQEMQMAHNEAIIEERDAGIRDIVRQVGLKCALY